MVVKYVSSFKRKDHILFFFKKNKSPLTAYENMVRDIYL